MNIIGGKPGRAAPDDVLSDDKESYYCHLHRVIHEADP